MKVPDHKNVDQILKEYDSRRQIFEDFRNACESTLRALLDLEEIIVHSVSSRVKERKKLAEKLTRKGKEYGTLEEVTDVVGIRVITHFEDEVKQVGSQIRAWFQIDEKNSEDKIPKDPDRFGYRSLHFVCSLLPNRLHLPENARFKNLRFEVQIRSILQHAWAEIEHDLSYKRRDGVPAEIKREFSQIAANLWRADRDFVTIRKALRPSAPQQPSQATDVDDKSLKAFLESDPLLNEITTHLENKIDTMTGNAADTAILIKQLRSCGIRTINDLSESLKQQRDVLLFQATMRPTPKKQRPADRAFGVVQLVLVLAAHRGGEEEIQRCLDELRPKERQSNQEVAREVTRRVREFQLNEFQHRKS